MFGPDVCGTSTKKIHVIFHYNGKNLLIKKEIVAPVDQLTHVFTLIVTADGTYEVLVDGERKEGGRLEDDFDFLAPKMIKDPSVSKPADWVDEPLMDDPEDVKPADWDSTPKEIPDPEAEKPSDWDDEADGEWEAPQIANPEYKGTWKPKRIANPAYKGKWTHPEIANPEYKEDAQLGQYENIGAVGFELWQVKSGTIFDNILVSDSKSEAATFRDQTWGANKDAEKAAFDAEEKKRTDKEEADRKAAEEARKAAEATKEEDEDEEDEDEDDDKDEL
jgi:calreticulin